MENKKSKRKSFSVIIETENLGMAGLDDLESSLNSLKQQTFPIDKANEVIIVAGGHLSKEAQDQIKEKFPWVILHLAKDYLTYPEAKRVGAQLATGEIVVLADSDVKYESTWLESLLMLFETHPDATVASGNTRLSAKSMYTTALNLTWMIHIYPKKRPPTPIKRFQFNNFAINRDVMLSVPFPTNLPLYRGEIRVWRERLLAEGHKFYRVPGALALHAPPGNLIDYWYRMLVYGSDSVAKADFSFTQNWGTIEKRSILKRFFYLGRLSWARLQQFFTGAYILISEDFRAITRIILSLPIAVVNNILIVLGGLIAVFNRDFIANIVKEREKQHIV